MAKIIRVWDGTQWQVVGTALPDALTVDGTQTLTNKSIALGSNTITGTTAQFNTALTDGNFATLAGSETLTNKTISGADNTLSNIPNNALSNSSITINGSAVSLGGSTTINTLPSQTSNSGKYLTTDGSSASWANVTNLVPTDSNISVPGAPTSVTATAGNAQATVSFSVPSDNGGSTILGYTIISNPGNIKKSTTLTTDTITGLTNGTSYTFTVKAHNIAGTSIASSASSSVTPDPGVSINYLIIAGGGSGGATTHGIGGGGGAGGLRSTVTATGGGGSLEPILTISKGVSYTVTVGAGGASLSSGAGNNGSNSVFSTITSTGGGGGGVNSTVPKDGGSGGGDGQAPGSGGLGTANQGFNGGAGGADSGGGGGGAGAAGGAGGIGDGRNGGAGGNGVATSITGTSVTRAGGGGGGGYYDGQAGAAGSGGGGIGGRGTGSNNVAPGNGTANTGSGGGGSGNYNAWSPQYASGSGGSGVVIISSPQVASATTGSPVATTSGGNYIYQFNSSGSITF